MKKLFFSFLITAVILNLFGCSSPKQKETNEKAALHSTDSSHRSPRPVHWGYHGDDGPEHWAALSPVYAACGEGKTQSPIDIQESGTTTGSVWNLEYKNTSVRIAYNEHMNEIIDNGHTIQASVDEGSSLRYGNKTYQLKQFHFHTPSEHTLDGEHLPMEMHMVHQASDGSLAVIGVFFVEGKKANENFNKIISYLPDEKGESIHNASDSLSIRLHIPTDHHAYHYIGSLTTPPCTENVQWLILKEKISLTTDQIKAFSSRIGPNNRPTQPLNKRSVELDELKESN
ncbi:carbonic anhydrase family protein [Pollutibacter soli]|uniref:carbonic anhydrase n=1 Tax=Pollutibacter soli TaxID=3034157 RepID=UPI003013FF37